MIDPGATPEKASPSPFSQIEIEFARRRGSRNSITVRVSPALVVMVFGSSPRYQLTVKPPTKAPFSLVDSLR
jgi:hypothetical protein